MRELKSGHFQVAGGIALAACFLAAALSARAQEGATPVPGLPAWRSDPSVHMIAIEALVVEVNEDKSRQLGLQYGYIRDDVSRIVEGADFIFGPRFNPVHVPTFEPGDGGLTGTGFIERLPGLGLTLAGLDVNGGRLSAQLRTLLDEGNARLSTRPIVMTLNGTETTLKAGSKVPFQQLKAGKTDKLDVTERDVGVELSVLPRIVDLQQQIVELNITKVSVSAVKNFVETSGILLPSFSSSETVTRVTVRAGETVKLSSMKLRRSRETREGIPYLRSIPWIGPLLFGSYESVEESVDVLFFVTPHIVPPGQNFLLPYDFGNGRELIDQGVILPDR